MNRQKAATRADLRRFRLCALFNFWRVCKLEQTLQGKAFVGARWGQKEASQDLSSRRRPFRGAKHVVGWAALGGGVTNSPVREQGQHVLEVGRFCEAMIRTAKNFQVFGAGQGIEEPPALMQWDILVLIALHDQGGGGDPARRVVGNLSETVLVERVVQRNTSGAAMKIGNAIRSFPFL